ncbi:MAG TPA: hypothetical protein VF292_05410 [Rhodanobacteraceae bacterium]
MQIRPILATLHHYRLTVAIIVVEIALAFAVLCNASFMVMREVGAMRVRSGIDEASLAVLTLDNFDRSRVADLNARVMAGLRGITGVQSVDAVDGLPFVDAGGGVLSPDRTGHHGTYFTNF